MPLLRAADARTLSMRHKFGNSIPLFNEQRVAALADKISKGLSGRLLQKWNGILAVDNTILPTGPLDPWSFPGHYEDPDGNAAKLAIFRADALPAVDLGVRWKILGDVKDAEAVVRLLTPWTTINTIVNNGNSRLPLCDGWPMFIQAAQLISDSPAYTPSFKNAMENLIARGLSYTTAYIQTENRAVWGCMYDVSAGAFLGDRKVFDRAIARWRELFEHDVKGNIPVGEILREANGLYYCNFLLNAMTQTAEIARVNGEWLYDFKTSDGSTYKGLWETVAGWTANPETYPYWPSNTIRIQAHVDPLHALWPNSDSQSLIDRFTTTQDYIGYRQGMLAYRDLPLWG